MKRKYPVNRLCLKYDFHSFCTQNYNTSFFYKVISSKVSFYSVTYNITQSSSENFPCFFHYKYPVSFIWIEKIACTSWSQRFYFFEKYFTNCHFCYRQNTFFSFVIILVLLIFFVKYSVWHRFVQLVHQNHPNSYYHDVWIVRQLQQEFFLEEN